MFAWRPVLLLSWLAALVRNERVKCDQDSIFEFNYCQYKTPQCLEYEYVPDNQNPGRYIFRCLACEEGLVPYWPYSNVSMRYDPQLPDQKLFMCAPNAEGKPSSCRHQTCSGSILPGCVKYTVKDPVFVKPGETLGHFECLQCDERYEPVAGGIYFNYSVTQERSSPLNVCTRSTGTFDCGVFCQAEFPGCARIQISKVQGGRGSGLPETATFRCIEAVPGNNIVETPIVGVSEYGPPKFVTLPNYVSDVLPCNTRFCQTVLPDCELYYKEHKDNIYETYYCKKCRADKIPKPTGEVGYNLILALLYNQPLQLCDTQPVTSWQCGADCKREFPGCDVLTISNLQSDWYNGTTAVYTCEKCADGFVPITNTTQSTGWYKGYSWKNVKARCIPREALQPTPVRGEIAEQLPKCLQYTAKLVPDTYFRQFEYACIQCEQGWEPISTPLRVDWFSSVERVLCRHAPLQNPVQCEADCKQDFPNCDKLTISIAFAGHNVYECLECSNGFYPIPYELEQFGRISVANHSMTNSSRIYLCSNQPVNRYHKLVKCTWPLSNDDEVLSCALDQNCRTVAFSRRLTDITVRLECLQCKEGYRPKLQQPSSVSADSTMCEQVPRSQEAYLSRPVIE